MVDPRRAYIVPVATLALGALIFGLNLLAKVLYPGRWGGPNFLGGAIAILGFVIAAVGVAAVVGTAIANRHDRRADLQIPTSSTDVNGV